MILKELIIGNLNTSLLSVDKLFRDSVEGNNWWLRSPGNNQNNAAKVNNNGNVNDNGNNVNNTNGIRPDLPHREQCIPCGLHRD